MKSYFLTKNNEVAEFIQLDNGRIDVYIERRLPEGRLEHCAHFGLPVERAREKWCELRKKGFSLRVNRA